MAGTYRQLQDWLDEETNSDSLTRFFRGCPLELHENPLFALQVSLIKSLASIMQPRMGRSYQRREYMRINLPSSFNHSSQYRGKGSECSGMRKFITSLIPTSQPRSIPSKNSPICGLADAHQPISPGLGSMVKGNSLWTQEKKLINT